MAIKDIALLFGGVQVVLIGLATFVGKWWLERLAQSYRGRVESQLEGFRAEAAADRQRLQHALDRQLHVHALQFEKELKVYEAIWGTLIDVAKAVMQLRPALDRYDPEETEEERKSKRLSRLADAGQGFLDEVNKEKPFYAPEVHTKLMALQATVQREAIEYQYGDPVKQRDYWEKALENSNLIRAQIDDACEAIRARIGVISAA